jgi:hypothetical protein
MHVKVDPPPHVLDDEMNSDEIQRRLSQPRK